MVSIHLFTISILLAGTVSHAASAPAQIGAFCASYTIQGYDTCASIAKAHGITEADIEAFNTNTWAWLGCNRLYQGDFICVSAGDPPMPVALPNAVCGPQIPGTTRPNIWADLGSMNPCPAGQCCSSWGQCGTGADFCDAKARKPPAGATATVSAATEVKPQPSTLATQAQASTDPVAPQPTQPKTTLQATTKSVLKSTSTSTSTSSNPTTAAAADGSKKPTVWKTPWEVVLYSKKDCEGDYYLVQGYNDGYVEDDNERCTDLKEGLNFQSSETNVSCQWFTNGGFTSAPCESGTLEKPQSWVLKNAQCNMYSTEGCDCFDHFTKFYTSTSCHNRDSWDPPKFRSMICMLA